MAAVIRSLDEALAPITDGCMLLVPRETAGVAMEATRALVRRGVKRLDLVTLPTSSLQADMLIGAGCVETIETSAVSLGRVRRRAALQCRGHVRHGAREGHDLPGNACAPAGDREGRAVHSAARPHRLRRAGASRRLARDRQSVRRDDPIVLLPALKADVALFHAPMADAAGNVWIGRQRELAVMAHAAEKTVVTVEKMYDGNLLADPVLAAGVLAGFYIEAVAVAPRGAWPLVLPDHYPVDGAHVAEYARMAATPEGFSQYLDRYRV